MATLQAIQNNVDASLNGLLVAIQNWQDAYQAGHGGRCAQGLRSHTVTPADDNATAPTIGTACPVGQPGEPWPAAVRSGNKKMALQCDCYRGPDGDGWQITVFVTVLSVEYARTVNFGPETYRNAAWHAVTAGP